MSNTKYSIGVDLGGTNIRVALLSEDGVIQKVRKEPTEANLGPGHVIYKMKRMIEEVMSGQNVIGIGIGSPGPLNPYTGVILDPPNLPGWKDIPLKALLEENFCIPVIVENDANAAALAEAHQGAGKGHSSVVYITWSTGIGAGLVFNGKVFQGAFGNAGEIGNTVLRSSDGSSVGVLEKLASGTAIGIQGKELLGLEENNAGAVFQLAASGNQQAKTIIDDAVKYVAMAVANLTLTLNPSVIVIGGGVMLGNPTLLHELTDIAKTYLYESMQNQLLIKTAELEDEAGLIGAGLLPFN
ncbi:glucokinase [Bacillus mesophilus]|uniref:ROK family protein n=1 Tax=Bacillus mesophilus TaxID=1808955 RepID=A0A6M0Q7T6_9BACI|nr:ROK family protein [Bacillus mesophilus]MBM7661758.1 glucokinase [Bacillus mesophilus]NEY72416.1 ROK family protein [Bacillus mesophilus]